MIRIGVAGFGYWGAKHVRVLTELPDIELTVIDQDERQLRQARTEWPGINLATDLDEVLGRLDGLVVATPSATHARLAVHAVCAGRPTLVEKPFALREEEGAEVVEAARMAGVWVMVGHTFEYDAAVQELRRIIRSGELGRVLHIDSTRVNLGRYQQDCNVIWDLLPHDISIVTYLLDEQPLTVSAWTQNAVGNVHADVAHLRLDFAEPDVVAFLHVSWLAPEKVRRITVVGDRKTAVYDDLASDGRIKLHDIRVQAGAGSPVLHRGGPTVAPSIPFNEPLLVQDKHFVDCVRTGAQPATAGERGLAVVRVLAAADRAASTGRPATVWRGPHMEAAS